MNKYDVYNWVKANINSSYKIEHYEGCRKLIHLFYTSFKDELLTRALNKYLDIEALNLNEKS